MLNKYSNKKIGLFILLDILLGAGVITLYVFDLIPEVVFIIGLFILLMIFSTLTSALMQRRLLKKMNKKRQGKTYTYQNEITLNNPIKTLKLNYGRVELYIENKVLYTLTIVSDPVIFFSEEQQEAKPKSGALSARFKKNKEA